MPPRSRASSRVGAQDTLVRMIGGFGVWPTLCVIARYLCTSSAAFGHSFCITISMPKPSFAMISADSGLTAEA